MLNRVGLPYNLILHASNLENTINLYIILYRFFIQNEELGLCSIPAGFELTIHLDQFPPLQSR